MNSIKGPFAQKILSFISALKKSFYLLLLLMYQNKKKSISKNHTITKLLKK